MFDQEMVDLIARTQALARARSGLTICSTEVPGDADCGRGGCPLRYREHVHVDADFCKDMPLEPLFEENPK